MKTQEQQKAELLDQIVSDIITNKDDHLIWIVSMYAEITAQKPLSADPYADEVFTGKCGALIINYAYYHICHSYGPKMPRKDMRLSDMPHLHIFIEARNVGRKSIEYYKDVMLEYGFNDKLE
jgi:hypothetical protein